MIRMTVAFARWQYPHNPTSDETAEKAALGKNEITKPKGYNVELDEKLCGAIDEFEHRWVDKTKDYSRSSFLPCSIALRSI